jgi:ribosomal protein L11 methyltransferase
MTHEWVEVQIESACDAGELLSLLDDPAVQGTWQEDGMIRLYWPAYAWSTDTLQGLRGWLMRLDETATQDRIRIDRLPDLDWSKLWVRSVQPLRIGRGVVVRPSWHRLPLQPGDVDFVIDPKQAFGTGRHTTTQLLVEWLEDVIHKDDRVLDVGTGSGFLAMVALRLGAANAMGLDTDPVAIECAREYAVANGFGSELDIRVATLDDGPDRAAERIDLVLANLDRQTLLELAPALCAYASRGARLLLSGLLVDQQAEVTAAFAANGTSVRTVRERDGWMALELVASESCEGEP